MIGLLGMVFPLWVQWVWYWGRKARDWWNQEGWNIVDAQANINIQPCKDHLAESYIYNKRLGTLIHSQHDSGKFMSFLLWRLFLFHFGSVNHGLIALLYTKVEAVSHSSKTANLEQTMDIKICCNTLWRQFDSEWLVFVQKQCIIRLSECNIKGWILSNIINLHKSKYGFMPFTKSEHSIEWDKAKQWRGDFFSAIRFLCMFFQSFLFHMCDTWLRGQPRVTAHHHTWRLVACYVGAARIGLIFPSSRSRPWHA